MENHTEMTLKQVAEMHGARVAKHNADLVVVSAKESKGMYFSGDVLIHISVDVGHQCGLNGTNEWPFYLVDDDGDKKIVGA